MTDTNHVKSFNVRKMCVAPLPANRIRVRLKTNEKVGMEAET
jgi:hypothetical protein